MTHNLSPTCVSNFTNKHMILNVVLVIKLYLGCKLIWSNCIIRVGQQGLQRCICVILGCCYSCYKLHLFMNVFSTSTASVYLCVSCEYACWLMCFYFCLILFLNFLKFHFHQYFCLRLLLFSLWVFLYIYYITYFFFFLSPSISQWRL